MRKLTFASIKMLFRDRQSLFWALMFPIIFTVIFGLFDFNKGPKVKVEVAGTASPVSQALTTELRKINSFDVTTRADETAARQRLSDGKLNLVVAVPSGAGAQPRAKQPADLRVYYAQGDANRTQLALSAIRQVVDGLNLRFSGIVSPPIAFTAQPVSAKKIVYYDFLLPGLVAMGVMNFSIVGMAVAIARFREQQILKRILATPLRPVRFLAAQVIARLVLSLVQAALILAVGVFGFHAHVYGNLVWIFVLAVLANLIFLNLAFAVAGRASNPDAAQGMGQAISIPMMFLSGVFFPTDTLPKALQTIVRYLPLTPIIKAMRTVAVDGKSLTAAGPQLLLLGAWIVAAFVIGSRTFKFSKA